MRNNLIIVFLSLLFFADGLIAQKEGRPSGPWSMQQCIDYALKTNLQLKQTQLNADLAQVNVLQSEAGALPSINGSATHTYNFGRTIDQYTNTFADKTVLSQNLYLSANLVLFNGLQRYNTIKQNQYSYAAVKYDVDKNRNDISLNVAGSYLQILFAQEILEVAKNQLAITKKQVERTQRLFEAGTVDKGSVLDLQAQQATDEQALTNAESQLDLANLALIQLMNLDSIKGFQIQKPEIALTTVEAEVLFNDPSQIYTGAVKQLPEVKSAELRLRSAEKGVAVAKGGISPQLSTVATYGTGYSGASQTAETYKLTKYNVVGFTATTGDPVLAPVYSPVLKDVPFDKQYSDNVNKTFGFRLQVPIFNGLQTHAAISRSKINRESAEITVDQVKQQLFKSIQQAYVDANASLKRYASAKKAVEANEESYKYSEQKYNVGAMNVFDYNFAKTKLAKAKSDLVQAKYDFVFKSKVLDFYQGKPLTL